MNACAEVTSCTRCRSTYSTAGVDAVAQAHQADLKTQGQYGVDYQRYWVDEERGKIFCDAVVRARGPAALHYVFSSPEALPTLAEIEDPAAWIARTGLSEPTERAQQSSA